MKRRRFVQGSVAVAAAAPVSVTLAAAAGSTPLASEAERLERVKRALLSMQRASLEQGVAAQAFLELGDGEQVFLMAKEAALRQTKEGRLSVLY